MNTVIHRAESRGAAEHGWLYSQHTFSFADYYDPMRMGFGTLRVINDDVVAPGAGFPTHGHHNMEIVSIPLGGALHHKDSAGHEQVIHAGEVQHMSAGTGIRHSEYNASQSEAVNFLQIWVLPRQQNVQPIYEHLAFPKAGRQNRFQFIVAPDRRDGSLGINQNAYFALAEITSGSHIDYPMQQSSNGIYVFVIEGKVEVAGECLNRRDGMGVRDLDTLTFSAENNTLVLVMEIPLNH